LNKFEDGYKVVEAEKAQLEQQNQELIQKINDLQTPEKIQKRELMSEYDLAYKEYLEAQENNSQTQKELYPYSSTTSSYGTEIVWFSVVVGLVFDFLLWKDIFAGKFGNDIWAERAERASAVIMSFSYAFVCAQLGAAYAVKMFTKKRSAIDNNSIEKTVYNKSTAKDTLGINLILFVLLTVLSTAARFTEEKLDLNDKFILSLAATTIGLVISAISYWYTDVYEHFMKAARNRERMAKKNFLKVSKRVSQNER